MCSQVKLLGICSSKINQSIAREGISITYVTAEWGWRVQGL